MAADQVTGHEDVAELRERLRLLEARVTRVEQGMGSAVPSEPQARAAVAVPATGFTVATMFTRVAMLSFVLMGALILRVLTEQHILGAWFGTLLGFAYAAHLIVLSFLPGRLGNLARTTSLFQCCGVVLGFCIAVESSLRAHTFGRVTAMAFMAGFAALGLCVAVVHRKRSLAVIAIAGSILALVALGLEPQGLALQLILLISLGAAAAGLSWRRDWGLLRPLVFPLLLGLLAVGFLLARQESLKCDLLLTSAAAFWVVILLQHLVLRRRLNWSAALWLPLVTAWLGGLVWFENIAWLARAGSAVSGMAILVMALTVRELPAATAGAAGLALTGVVAGSIGWPMLDASGILCALAGTGLWMGAGKGHPSWAAGCTVFLLALAAVRGLLHVVEPLASVSSLFAGAFLGALLLSHYLRTGGAAGDPPSDLSQHLAPAALVAGLLVLFGVFRAAAHRFFPDPALFQLSQTGVLTLTATALTFWGHTGRRPVKYVGLACMVVSLVKVGLGDLVQLSGLPLIGSVVMLGLSSVAISVILHRRPDCGGPRIRP